jgi:transcription antitermination factor NusG
VYWACAQLEAHRERLALHTLGLAGYTTYLPRIRIQRRVSIGSRKLIDVATPLFPGYAFVLIELQWHAARWSPGVIRLVFDGLDHPARVPDTVIADLRQREVNGFVVLSTARTTGFKRGDQVRVVTGPATGQLAIFNGMKARERVEVLLMMLGASRHVELARAAIRSVRAAPG